MGAPVQSRSIDDLYEEPTFEEYVAARKVVLFIYEQLRQEKYSGKLNIASDEMVARIIQKSCYGLQKAAPALDSTVVAHRASPSTKKLPDQDSL